MELFLRVEKLTTEQILSLFLGAKGHAPVRHILCNQEESSTSGCVFWGLGKWLFFKEVKIIM